MKKIDPETMRQYLMTFAVCLSYVTFMTMGIIITKYNPVVVYWVDYAFIPIGASTVLFIYLFAITYEKRMYVKLDDLTLEIVKEYGKGKSFETIKNELGLPHVNEVKRAITKYCKVRSN